MDGKSRMYSGSSFSIDRVGNDWTIWRFCDSDGSREELILMREAMAELRDFFVMDYNEVLALGEAS